MLIENKKYSAAEYPLPAERLVPLEALEDPGFELALLLDEGKVDDFRGIMNSRMAAVQ